MKKWTSLGHLKHMLNPDFEYFEWQYLKFIKNCLVDDWPLIQGGVGQRALDKLEEIFKWLELDTKAIKDLMLLSHSGECGLAEANELLWNLLSYWAIRPEYEDLSHKVSHLVGMARRNIDRPPARHADSATWHWRKYLEARVPHWGPKAVPQVHFRIITGPGGVPLAPPKCWVVNR